MNESPPTIATRGGLRRDASSKKESACATARLDVGESSPSAIEDRLQQVHQLHERKRRWPDSPQRNFDARAERRRCCAAA